MLGAALRVPVARAVDRQHGNRAASRLDPASHAIPPIFTVLLPALFEFDDKPGRRGVAALSRDRAWPCMSLFAHAHGGVHALRLESP